MFVFFVFFFFFVVVFLLLLLLFFLSVFGVRGLVGFEGSFQKKKKKKKKKKKYIYIYSFLSQQMFSTVSGNVCGRKQSSWTLGAFIRNLRFVRDNKTHGTNLFFFFFFFFFLSSNIGRAATIALKAYSSYTTGPIDSILGRKHRGDL